MIKFIITLLLFLLCLCLSVVLSIALFSCYEDFSNAEYYEPDDFPDEDWVQDCYRRKPDER